MKEPASDEPNLSHDQKDEAPAAKKKQDVPSDASDLLDLEDILKM